MLRKGLTRKGERLFQKSSKMGSSVSTNVAVAPQMYQSVRSEVSSTEEVYLENRANTTLRSTVHGNLMRCQHRLDPMKYYSVCAVLGEGSMVRS